MDGWQQDHLDTLSLPPNLPTRAPSFPPQSRPHTTQRKRAPRKHKTQQPVFATIEDLILRCAPSLQFSGPRAERALRLGYRTAYVGVTALVACALPFFDAFTGLVGAITYFPTAVAYPIAMYLR